MSAPDKKKNEQADLESPILDAVVVSPVKGMVDFFMYLLVRGWK